MEGTDILWMTIKRLTVLIGHRIIAAPQSIEVAGYFFKEVE